MSSAVSLLNARSFPWALAGPFLLAVMVMTAGGMRTDSRVKAVILGSAVFIAGAIVAVADHASVPMIMPILGACAAVSVIPPERACSRA